MHRIWIVPSRASFWMVYSGEYPGIAFTLLLFIWFFNYVKCTDYYRYCLYFHSPHVWVPWFRDFFSSKFSPVLIWEYFDQKGLQCLWASDFIYSPFLDIMPGRLDFISLWELTGISQMIVLWCLFCNLLGICLYHLLADSFDIAILAHCPADIIPYFTASVYTFRFGKD